MTRMGANPPVPGPGGGYRAGPLFHPSVYQSTDCYMDLIRCVARVDQRRCGFLRLRLWCAAVDGSSATPRAAVGTSIKLPLETDFTGANRPASTRRQRL